MGIVNSFPLTTVFASDALEIAPRIITSGATIVVADDDELIVLNYASITDVAITLPPVASRVPAGKLVKIIDWSGYIGTLTITPDATLSEEIMGAAAAWTAFNGQAGTAQTGTFIELIPSVDLNGWMVR